MEVNLDILAKNEIVAMKSRRPKMKRSYSTHAEFMYSHARAVIEIDENMNVINSFIRTEGWTANTVVVIGKITGEEKAIRLEICFRMSAPYRPFRTPNHGRPLLNTDHMYRPLSNAESLKIIPEVFRMVQVLVDMDAIESWDCITSPYFKRNPKFSRETLLRGYSIAVSRDDEVILYYLLSRVMIGRVVFIKFLHEQIRDMWKGMRKSHYPKKQFGSMAAIREVKSLLDGRYTEEQLTKLQEIMHGTKEGSLLRQLRDQFHLRRRGRMKYEKKFLRLQKKYKSLGNVANKFNLSAAIHWKVEENRLADNRVCVIIHPTAETRLALQLRYEENLSKPDSIRKISKRKIKKEVEANRENVILF